MLSDPDRAAYFEEGYMAADAFPLTERLTPSIHSDRIVRGEPSATARLVEGFVEIMPSYGSFFGDLLSQGTAGKSADQPKAPQPKTRRVVPPKDVSRRRLSGNT